MWWTVLKESISDELKKEVQLEYYKKIVDHINESFSSWLNKYGYTNFSSSQPPEIFTIGSFLYQKIFKEHNQVELEFFHVWEIDFHFDKFWELAKEHLYESLPKDTTITIQSFKEGDPKKQTLEQVLVWAKDRLERGDVTAMFYNLENAMPISSPNNYYKLTGYTDIEMRSNVSSINNYKDWWQRIYNGLISYWTHTLNEEMPPLLNSLPSKEHIEYALKAKDEKTKSLHVKTTTVASDDLSWYKPTNTFYSEHIPDERGIYNMLTSVSKGFGKKAQWLVYPRIKSRSGGGQRAQIEGKEGLGSQYWNYDGLLWMQSVEDEDSFLINVDTIGAHGVLGVCVNVRGRWIPFEEYDFTTIKVKEKTKKEKAGLLTQRLFGTPADTDVDKKNIELEKMKTGRARVVFDFITSWEETSKGPQFGDRATLPRWTKVAIGLGRGRNSTECIYNPDKIPRGDKVASLMNFQYITRDNANTAAQIDRSVERAMRRPEPHIYPLEHTLKVLEDKFGFWDPTNEESNKRALDYLEENNYMFKKNGEGVDQFDVGALMGR